MPNSKATREYALDKFRRLPDHQKDKLNKIIDDFLGEFPDLTYRDMLELLLVVGTFCNEREVI